MKMKIIYNMRVYKHHFFSELLDSSYCTWVSLMILYLDMEEKNTFYIEHL